MNSLSLRTKKVTDSPSDSFHPVNFTSLGMATSHSYSHDLSPNDLPKVTDFSTR